MPQTYEIWLLIIGAIFLLIGFLSGNLEIKSVIISPLEKTPRIILSIIGTVFIVISLSSLFLGPTPENIPPQTLEPTAMSIPQSTNTPASTSTPSIESELTATPITVREPKIISKSDSNSTVSVAHDQPIIVRLTWGAKTENLAETNADLLQYTLLIDGNLVPLLDDYRKPAIFEPDSFNGEDAWWVFWDVELESLPVGEHLLTVQILFVSDVFDGWYTSSAGGTAEWQATINVVSPQE
jgi:hypothetical protein